MSFSIEKCATDLAHEISNRSRFNVEEISILIQTQFKMQLLSFIQEQATIEEREYQKLLELQSGHKMGTPEYNKVAYRLSAVKSRKVLANRAVNNVLRDIKFSSLKDLIVERYGPEAMAELYLLLDKKQE